MKALTSAIICTLLLTLSCTAEDKTYGSRIDQIDIQVKPGAGAERTISDEEAIKLAVITPLMQEKAEAFTKATQNADRSLYNSVYVYASTITKYESAPKQLAARLYLLGYNGVYLSPGGSRLKNASEFLRTFISTCSALGMKVYATYYEDNQIFSSETRALECINAVLTYNKTVAFEERFAGISADLEPHTIKTDVGVGYIWNTQSNMGIGKANDQLLKITLDRLTLAQSTIKTSGLKLQEALWCHYQRFYNEGQLSYGCIPQFTKVCDWVVLMAYSNTTDKIWDICKANLEAADKKQSVSICVKTATNDEASTTILPNGWNALIDTMTELRKRASEYESFCGLDMFKYEALETMWEWVNDKN